MTATSSRSEAGAVADVSKDQAVDPTPPPKLVKKRFFNLPVGERLKQFAIRLKANAKWTKQFLHGSK